MYLHRAENRLLHFLAAPRPDRPQREFAAAVPDRRDLGMRWTESFAGWFQLLHIETTYRRLPSVLELSEEALSADIVTDLAAIAETAEITMPPLAGAAAFDESCIEDLAYFHVISPWKQHGMPALLDALHWLAEFLRENDEL